ncbi:hypothetical protein [Aurantivibrio plasticivorans]
MKVAKTMLPGQMGSQQHSQRWGKSLVCVRYRDDTTKKKRYTTVEIIVEERTLVGALKRVVTKEKLKPHDRVGVKINFVETELRAKVKSAGGVWLKGEKLWVLQREQAILLGLNDRIVDLRDI